jgi:hypothetical protein
VSEKKEDWCPTRGGQYAAYLPEYETDEGKWEEVPTVELKLPYAALGVPAPVRCGGITKEIGLFGRAQAWALAWKYAADEEATTGREVNIRVAQYEVHYDIKAKRLDHVFNICE